MLLVSIGLPVIVGIDPGAARANFGVPLVFLRRSFLAWRIALVTILQIVLDGRVA